jgi:glycosyltransferase involved in cell wall biosynthesis
MSIPLVSVIIPTYNGADFLGEAIQSVLEQTYANFELIVVNDASPDNTEEVVKMFDDNRLKYIAHKKNSGVGQARHTGLQASKGEIIFLLDQDDYYHPDKLQSHVTFHERHPDVGFTYNARFELNYSAKTIRNLWRPPNPISLVDLVTGFPIAPTDAVITRKWALEGIEWLGQRRGAEIAQFGRLFMAGCKFGYVDRALNYRRHHSGRNIKDLRKACENEVSNQVLILNDSHFPAELADIGNVAHANLYIYWAFHAFRQGETALGQEFVKKAVELKPSIVKGKPSELMGIFLINSVDDEHVNHESMLENMLTQLPPEASCLSDELNWAVREGYLLKCIRAVIWDRPEDGNRHFEQAVRLGASIDDYFLDTLTQKLLDYRAEYGIEAAQEILSALTSLLQNLAGGNRIRSLVGNYLVNLAFQYYHKGEYAKTHETVINAIGNDPKYLINRGVLSILGRSTFRLLVSAVKPS